MRLVSSMFLYMLLVLSMHNNTPSCLVLYMLMKVMNGTGEKRKGGINKLAAIEGVVFSMLPVTYGSYGVELLLNLLVG